MSQFSIALSALALIMLLVGGLQAQAAGGLPFADSRLIPAPAEEYLRAMQSGGPGKDGIPSIDKPQFWNPAQADQYLDPGDIVFGVYHNGEARAYPQRILVWHEIVNDEVGGKPVSVTYCPLTATAIGFERGNTELGVSGNLINSNMVMYDRATDSYWPQILGVAIRGPNQGRALSEHRVVWTTWERWQQRHPDTRVLSTDTGFMRDYQRDPYGQYNPPSGYYKVGTRRMFPVMHEASGLPEKQTILGFRTTDLAAAVDMDYLRNNKIVRHTQHGDHYVIVYDPGLDTGWVYHGDSAVDIDYQALTFGPAGPEGEVLNKLTPVNAFKGMWFAWSAFYPDTVVLHGTRL